MIQTASVTIPARDKNDPRVEDEALVRGAGQFVDDPRLPGQAFGAFVRSPHAHARIVSIDTEAALAAKGVVAVLTAADIKAEGVGSLARHPQLPGRNGTSMALPFRPVLAETKALHVGDPVALVIAESAALAADAADLVAVEYEELTPVVDLAQAMAAETLVDDTVPGNLLVDWPGLTESKDNEKDVDDALASAAHVAKVAVTNQRMASVAMETRGATGLYDKASGNFTLYTCSQGAEMMRVGAAGVLNIPKEKLRVVTNDVGGAFGMKTPVYPEYIAVLIAAKKTGRPVHWMSTRSEAFVTDTHARDTVTHVELAMNDKGKFLALRVRHLCNNGAYVSNAGVMINCWNFAKCLPAMYDIRKIDVGVACYLSNTVPTGPYRGAGRPEANYALERAVEEAARLLKMDPVKLRKKNLIPASAMPFKTPLNTYDSGDFPGLVDKALELADYANFAKRKKEAARRGKLRGIGISCMLEHAGGSNGLETASISFPGGDSIVLGCNVQSTGQSHATVFARVLATKLGIDAHTIKHRNGDTNLGLTGFVSAGSRSAMCAGAAILNTADTMLKKAKAIAASALEAAESDILYENGEFKVVGTNHSISLFDTAARAKAMGESLDTIDKGEAPLTFPNGCHIAEVEIDPDTGHFDIVTYTAVDDCGNMLDKAVVEGQVQGSIAQGLGQAFIEHIVYDQDSGQLVSGSFMDYGMPRAHHMPIEFREGVHATPAASNPLGVKGTGEAGTTAAIAAVMNAIANAVPNGAADHMDMPATPAKVWEACQRGMAAD